MEEKGKNFETTENKTSVGGKVAANKGPEKRTQKGNSVAIIISLAALALGG